METTGTAEPTTTEWRPPSAGERPNYTLPPFLAARVAWDVLWGRKRSIGADVARAVRLMRPAPVYKGLEHIPSTGSLVLLTNHYQRPGLWVGFGGFAAIAAIVQQRPDLRDTCHAIGVGGWVGGKVGRIPIPDRLTSWAFERVANSYNLILVPPDRTDTFGQAAAVRRAVKAMRDRNQARALLLSPEGDVGDGLIEARPGVGTFMHLLSRMAVPLLPCAFYDEGGRLLVRFGPAFHLQEQAGAERDNQDRAARDKMMLHIGRLLPPTLWGYYRDLLARDEEAQA